MGCLSRVGAGSNYSRHPQVNSRALGLLLHPGAPVEIIRGRDGAVFQGLIGTRGADQDFVVREVELKRRAPGIDNLAFIIQVASAYRQNEDLLVGLTEQGLDDLLVVSDRVCPDELFVLLDTQDQVVAISVEFDDLLVHTLECPSFSHPEDTSCPKDPQHDHCYRNESFHILLRVRRL